MTALDTTATAQVTIWQTTNAIVAARALHVVAELGVADHIGEDVTAVDVVAAASGAEAGPLDRVLRLLASIGIFERRSGGYAHTDASRLLRSDAPGSMRGFARMMNLPIVNEAFTHLEHAVRTGEPAVKLVEPRGFWAYFGEHPEQARIFGEAMQAKAAADIASVLGAYDFRRFETVADIGGGLGHMLRAILLAVPTANGILYDLPEVIASLPASTERLTPVAGDFFRDALPRADAYILMEVLHDWTDEDCVRILSAVRRAAPPAARLVVIEGIVSQAGNDPRVNTLDVLMLGITGGRERTEAELDRLFAESGFQLTSVVSTAGPMKVVEGVVV